MGAGVREKESTGVNDLFQKIRRHQFFSPKRQKETRPVLKIWQDKAGVFSTVGPGLDKVDFPFMFSQRKNLERIFSWGCLSASCFTICHYWKETDGETSSRCLGGMGKGMGGKVNQADSKLLTGPERDGIITPRTLQGGGGEGQGKPHR